MLDFAKRTGLRPGQAPERYLWTDAFALCNLIELARAYHDGSYLTLAEALVQQVHHVLGRHRGDDGRTGWLSGLTEAEGAAHPTVGGLRIGKPLPERPPGTPLDDTLEWERDGQYFHYLTRWMHALDQLSRATRNPQDNLWARELAVAAHDGFVAGGPGQLHMVWKMTVDLTRPLIATMGHHDALDGYITCAELRSTSSLMPGPLFGPHLQTVMGRFKEMLAGQRWTTSDPLGLGGLLTDAARLAQLSGYGDFSADSLLDQLLADSAEGLARYTATRTSEGARNHRLAFRELGLAIGLQAIDVIRHEVQSRPYTFRGCNRLWAALERLEHFKPLATDLTHLYVEAAHQADPGWRESRNINEVMLATSLLPAGYLVLLRSPLALDRDA